MHGDPHDEGTAASPPSGWTGYGPPPGHGPQASYGPGFPPPAAAHHGRPGRATTAAVLGFVTGGLTALVVLGSVLLTFVADGDGAPVMHILFGLPCAVGLLYGGVQLMAHRRVQPLFVAAAGSVMLLLVMLLAGGLTGGIGGLAAAGTFLLFALPLPVLTAAFTRSVDVLDWAVDGED